MSTIQSDSPIRSEKQKAYVVNESGLYSILVRSDKPKAKPFRKWLTSEVIPTIRRTGGYVANEEMFIENYLPFLKNHIKIFSVCR